MNPIQELSGGTVDANMLDGLGVDEYFQRADLLGTWDYLDDALGSTLALADPTGTVQTEYTYSPFGNTTTQGSSSSNSYQFTGRENDSDALYYFRARYYDPMLSRFVSQDPTGFVGGVNVYAYVQDDPTNLTDLLGLAPCGNNVGHCVANALQANAIPLALDAAGFIPGARLGGELAGTLKDVGVGIASTIYSAAHQDTGGALLGIAGIHIAALRPVAEGAGEGLLSAVPGIGDILNAVSSGRDLYKAYEDYEKCVNGR